ncbi:FtsX-like permease family protein [Companilactobacillus kimchiensis]|uniref:ABC3 transporter permease C-terminal domain-containing protein n=1 Tax=Companilactobacillus kimchiensis TaxID=993692 RepID=A0A0R2LGU0_9LACO|nr:FtsX-like permease family protein [Companilactobacillus kimchiensis]KRO00790.1 hypothetical protein IV57_GL000110 [Companilactobacillus kimchiensis]
MIRLGLLQFKSSIKMWLTGIFVFIVYGWLISFCLTGAVTLEKELSSQQNNPLPIFVMPMFFGGITLFFVISNVIKTIVNELSDEYRMWMFLGADSRQISIIIAVQLSLVGFIGSCLGYIVMLFSIDSIYNTLQNFIGKVWLPEVNFKIIPMLFVIVNLLSIMICFLSGVLNSKKILKIRSTGKYFKLIIQVVVSVGFIVSSVKIILISSRTESGRSLFLVLFWMILFQIYLGQDLIKILAKIGRLLLPENCGSTGNLAIQQTSVNASKIRDDLIPIIVVQTIIYGLIELLFGLSDPNNMDMKNIVVSFIIYVDAPLIIVIANTVSVAMLKQPEQYENFGQLSRIGFTRGMLIHERSEEILFNSCLLFIVSLISNIFLYFIVRDHLINAFNTMIIIDLPLMVSGLIFVVLVVMETCNILIWYDKNLNKNKIEL